MRVYAALLIFACHVIFCYEEKPIVVVILSYNNAQWYKRNLDSVRAQKYDNYRIIYIDDASTDTTAQLVRSYINEHGLDDKITFICNKTNCGAMANHYKAAWMCADDEIIVHLDGDDWFKHNKVLARVNNEYHNLHVWLTYGQFERYPTHTKGYCKPLQPFVIQHNLFRECDWVTSHMRTFYAGLFKQIKLKEFIYEGNYFRTTCDMAMMFPLLELAGNHSRCIEDVLYVYNEETPLNDYKTKLIDQLRCDRVIRSQPKYQATASYRLSPLSKHIHLILFCSKTSVDNAQLHNFIDMHQIDKVTVFYTDKAFDRNSIDASYDSYYCNDDLPNHLESIASQSGYILCLHDNYMLCASLPLQRAIAALEQTGALSFHFALGADVNHVKWLHRVQRKPPLLHVADNIYAWQYKDGEFAWRQPYGAMTLYRASHLYTLIQGAQFANFDQYIYVLQSNDIDLEDIGLCCNKSCAVQELPDYFSYMLVK